MSSKITNKTLNDLEFFTVLARISGYCTTSLGKENVLKIEPITNKANLLEKLQQTNEYLASFQNENKIPNHHFEEITKEIHILGIEDSFLEAPSFQQIVSISNTVNELLKFFKKFKAYHPHLYAFSEPVDATSVIVEHIDKIINRLSSFWFTKSL